ncbi:hypothetical protein ACEPAI_4109 [Sanghuangporus weigelae]
MARAASPSASPTPPSQLRHSGFTHTLFFDHPPSANNDDRVLRDLRYAIKQGEKRDNAGETEDEKYGLYYYNALNESSERRVCNSIRRLIPGKFKPMRDYSKLIEKCHKKIVDNYLIDELAELRDYICILGVGEGAYPAIAIAQILSKVGIIQKWALELEDNFPLVFKLATSRRYNDKARDNFRFIRTQFARVDLFCLDKDIPGSDKAGENIGYYTAAEINSQTYTSRFSEPLQRDTNQGSCRKSLQRGLLRWKLSWRRISRSETRTELAVFRGSHSDIGGESKSQLRLIPLRYAIGKANTMAPKLRFRFAREPRTTWAVMTLTRKLKAQPEL